jgi:methionine-S-sulfoxide reductase
VGYAGGSKSNPTYRSLGHHSETIQIDYDPDVISYGELLEIFWSSHNPVSRSISSQYGSVVFYHDGDQKSLAEKVKGRQEDEMGRQLPTEIVPYTEFWLAENYHQKYRLRGAEDLMEEFRAMYPDPRDFVDSTAAARVNGYVGGNGTLEQFEEEVDELGLSPEGRERLEGIARRRIR